VQLRLFAPFLPYVTEEVWSWWQTGSVHRAPWPDAWAELAPSLIGHDRGAERGESAMRWGESPVLDAVSAVLAAVRREKTAQKKSMRARVASLTVVDHPQRLDHLRSARRDLLDAGGIDAEGLVLRAGAPSSVTVLLDKSA
jgi:valyl-tRNA synthetase